jgi:predicted ABC-type ATPase
VVADIAEALRAAIGNHPPVLIFLAGPNGAGKSTFHQAYLADLGMPFVNADVIRKEIPAGSVASAAEADIAAFRQAEEYRLALVDARTSFCTETVFSDPRAGRSGFRVSS